MVSNRFHCTAVLLACVLLFIPLKVLSASEPDCEHDLAPAELALSVWRYNTALTDSSFDSAEFMRVIHQPELAAYTLDFTGSLRSGQFFVSPWRRKINLIGGYPALLVTDPLKAEMASGGEGDGIFERNQSFALSRMEQTHYLTGDERAVQLAISKDFLRPEQVTIVEATEKTDTVALKAKYGDIPPHARPNASSLAWVRYQSYFDGYEPSDNLIYDLKVGSSWLISGQVAGRSYPLALEASPLKNPIDRRTFKYVWEIGRAGQEGNYGFEETLKANMFFALHELLLAGGSLDEGYVFAHAMDHKRSLIFKRKYGMKEFSHYAVGGKESERVMLAPLKALIARFEPSAFSATVRQIAGMEPALSRVDIYQMVLESRQLANQLLEDANAPESGVIEVRDFSNLRIGLFERFLKVPDEGKRAHMALLLANNRPAPANRDSFASQVLRDRSQAANFTRPEIPTHTDSFSQIEREQNLDDFLWGQNAIEIHVPKNHPIPPERTPEDVILGVYDYYISFLHSRGIADPAHLLISQRVRFALTTAGMPFSSGLDEVAPRAHWRVYRPGVVLLHGGFSPFSFGYSEHVPAIDYNGWSYGADQLEALRKKAAPRARYVLGAAHRVRFISDPELLRP